MKEGSDPHIYLVSYRHKKIQVALTVFEPMTSAMLVQYQLSFQATQLGAGQFVGFICCGEGTQ